MTQTRTGTGGLRQTVLFICSLATRHWIQQFFFTRFDSMSRTTYERSQHIFLLQAVTRCYVGRNQLEETSNRNTELRTKRLTVHMIADGSPICCMVLLPNHQQNHSWGSLGKLHCSKYDCMDPNQGYMIADGIVSVCNYECALISVS